MSIQRSINPSYGGVEAGGTKFVCAVGRGVDDISQLAEIPTSDPVTTIREAIQFFRSKRDAGHELSAIGIGAFGPIELNADAVNYGHITTTPKQGWQNVDINGAFARGIGLPIIMDTDVNAAALGELRWGAGRDLDHFLYVTVGTGIGVGAVIGGVLLRGEHHPEMGHMFVPGSSAEPSGFGGVCPFHATCVEGLASGTAIVKRWGGRLRELPPDHPAWQLEAEYLAMFLANLTFTLQPQRIVVGGGVMNIRILSMVRTLLHACVAGYRVTLRDIEAVNQYLILPELGGRAGVLGAIALANQARVRDPARESQTSALQIASRKIEHTDA